MKKNEIKRVHEICTSEFIRLLKNPSETHPAYIRARVEAIVDMLFALCHGAKDSQKFQIREDDEVKSYTRDELIHAVLNKKIFISDLILTPNNELLKKIHIKPFALIQYIRKLPQDEKIQHLMFICLYEPHALFYDNQSMFNPWDEDLLGSKSANSVLQLSLYNRILSCHDECNDELVTEHMMRYLLSDDLFQNYCEHVLKEAKLLVGQKSNNQVSDTVNDQILKIMMIFVLHLDHPKLASFKNFISNQNEIINRMIDFFSSGQDLDNPEMGLHCIILFSIMKMNEKYKKKIAASLNNKLHFSTAFIVYLCENDNANLLYPLQIIDQFNQLSPNPHFWLYILWSSIALLGRDNVEKYKLQKNEMLKNIFQNRNDEYIKEHFISFVVTLSFSEIHEFLMSLEMQQNRMILYVYIVSKLKDKFKNSKTPLAHGEMDMLGQLEKKVCSILLSKDASPATVKLALDVAFPIEVILESMVDEKRSNTWFYYDNLIDEMLLRFNEYFNIKNKNVDCGLQLRMLFLVLDQLAKKHIKKNTPIEQFKNLVFNENNQAFFQYARENVTDIADVLIKSAELRRVVFDLNHASSIKYNIKEPISKDLLTVLSSSEVPIEFLFTSKAIQHTTLMSALFKQSGFVYQFFQYFKRKLLESNIPQEHLALYQQFCQQNGHLFKDPQLLFKLLDLKLFDLHAIQMLVIKNDDINTYDVFLQYCKLDDLYLLRGKNKSIPNIDKWQSRINFYIEERQKEHEKIILTTLIAAYNDARDKNYKKDENIVFKRAKEVSTTVKTLLTTYPNICKHHSVSVDNVMDGMARFSKASNKAEQKSSYLNLKSHLTPFLGKLK